jgi:acyl carrier protein
MDKINIKNMPVEVNQIVCDQYNTKDINSENNFNTLGDEFDFIELIMKIEDHFEISISDSDASNITNIENLINYLSSKYK